MTDPEFPYELGDHAFKTAKERRHAIVRWVSDAERLRRDPNFEKSGYAPRKATLAGQVAVLGQMLLDPERVGAVVDEVFDALDAEPGFFHYPATNEEWGKLRRRIRRRLRERDR